MTDLRSANCVASDGSLRVGLTEFLHMLQSQRFLTGDEGRYWVALSLREAESLRGALHVCMDLDQPLVSGRRVAVGLRTK